MIQRNVLPNQQEYTFEDIFPVFYSAEGDGTQKDLDRAFGWLKVNTDSFAAQLSAHGAILIRGLNIKTDEEFDRFIQLFGWHNFTYAESLSNAVRRNRTERVFTANEAPSEVSIFLHHEMAQTPVSPSKLFFYCEQAASKGGATPICRSDILLERMRLKIPKFIDQCVKKGVRYSQTMPLQDDFSSGQGRSWKDTLSAQNQLEAEEKLTKLGYIWSWREDLSLSVTSPTLPAVHTLEDGRDVFFNQLIAAFRGWKDLRDSAKKSIQFGDYSTIDSEDMAVAIELAEELTFDIVWQTGDVVLLDNYLVMHGRRPFQGVRKVLASLVA
jgi:hypothetical protein